MSDATELSVFTVVYAHCLALQVAKDLNTYGLVPSAPLLWTAALAASIAAAHIWPSSSWTLLGLAVTGLAVLCLHGSQSNHIIVKMALTLAVLLTAPWPGATADGVRRRWSARLSLSIRWMLGVLYGSAALSKLNDAWFDPATSCCVQMAAAMMGGWTPTSPLFLRALPLSAVAFEVGFPVLLLFALVVCRTGADAPSQTTATGRLVLRGLMVAGAGFHVAIALPPPPLSVYPFTMLMAPFYVLGFLPIEVGIAARRLIAAPRLVHTALFAAAAASVGFALRLSASTKERFEYPPYLAWELGVLWSLVAFGSIALIGIFAPFISRNDTPPPSNRNAVPVPNPSQFANTGGGAPTISSYTLSPARLLLCLAPSVLLALVALTAYLGIRTHPALAMFSNLEIGGGVSNHWLFGPSWLTPHQYSAHRAILIVDTDYPPIALLQVNLAPLLPNTTRSHISAAGACPDFYISPPGWGGPPTEPFRPFSVPVVEVRRCLAPVSFASAAAFRTIGAAFRGGGKGGGGGEGGGGVGGGDGSGGVGGGGEGGGEGGDGEGGGGEGSGGGGGSGEGGGGEGGGGDGDGGDAAAASVSADFFMRYFELERGVAVGEVKIYRRVDGVRTEGSDPQLDAPLPPLRALLHRFRPFDHIAPVCRH